MTTQEKTIDFEAFRREEYKAACEEMSQVMTQLAELKERESELRKAIIDMSGGDRMEYGIKVTERIRKGAIDYKKVVEHIGVDEATLEFHRKAPTSFFEIKKY